MPTKVYYNDHEVIGDPMVSRTYAPIDQGDRWGMVDNITLNGTLTGVSYCIEEVGRVRCGYETADFKPYRTTIRLPSYHL